MRSLFAGVSGLRNHQLRMDVIGNNIANVNTVGFKSGRVNFQESLSQLLQGASRPSSSTGGKNPMQIGTGMQVGSIDTLFTQGSLEPTGEITDLAIQGDGFFIVNDGNMNYYTRAGNFQVDAVGTLVHPGTGFVLQGIMADSTGVINSSSTIEDIVLPFGQKVPALATSRIDFSCNLNEDSVALAQQLGANFAKAAEAKASATPTSLTITGAVNDAITMDVLDYMGNSVNATITLSAATYSSVDDLVEEINTQIQADSDLAGKVVASVIDVGGNDAIMIATTESGGDSTRLTLSGNACANLNLPTTLQTGTTATTLISDLPATITDLTNGDKIVISGVNPDGTTVSHTYTYTVGDTVQDLMDDIDAAYINASATIDDQGRLVLTDTIAGDTQTNIAMAFQDVDNSGSIITLPSFLTQVEGSDGGTHSTSITVYDTLGDTHTVTVSFENISTTDMPNVWQWRASVDDGDIIPSTGHTGTVRFDGDGSLMVFSSDDGQPLTFNPGNGADVLNVNLNAGTPGEYTGITQLASPSTTVAKYQDGYGMGNLQSISFDEIGKITGQFSNGVSQTLAQLSLAVFNNPAGLNHSGNSLYSESPNSGNPVKGMVGTSVTSRITPGALEMSNVDLAEEFTQMIIAQRGFQANARVISTSDTILDEIVRLKR